LTANTAARRLHRGRARAGAPDARPRALSQTGLQLPVDRRLRPVGVDVRDAPLITLYVQTILGYGPLQTGLCFLPLTVLSFLPQRPP